MLIEKTTDVYGLRPLHHAINAYHTRDVQEAVITVLVKAGVDLEAKTPSGYTALSIALRRGSSQLIYDLIKMGATKDFTSLNQIVALNRPITALMPCYDLDASIRPELRMLAKNEKTLALLDFILQLNKAENDPSIGDSERATLMFTAVDRGYDILVRRLLIDPNSALYRDMEGNTALHLVVKKLREIEENKDVPGLHSSSSTYPPKKDSDVIYHVVLPESYYYKCILNLLLRVSDLKSKNNKGMTAYEEGNELARSMFYEMRRKIAVVLGLKKIQLNIPCATRALPGDVRKLIVRHMTTENLWLPRYLRSASSEEKSFVIS